MTKEEIIKEIKNDDEQMFQLTTSATFLSLYLKLNEKGILTQEDIKDMNKKTNELTEELIEKCAKLALERLGEE